MENELKSIAYACISKGIQIYIPEDERCILGCRLVCNECNEPWYMNLTECFICGAINPFLYRCDSCGAYISITNAGKKCNKCGKEGTLHLECPNPNCLTNTDSELHKNINKKGGVFNKNSGFLISLQYCLKCGGQLHNYQIRKLYVKTINKKIIHKKEILSLIKNDIDKYTFIIFRIPSKKRIRYSYLKPVEILKTKKEFIKLKNVKEEFEEIINEIFNKRYD